ncbi:exosortase/archaeosortase family protein [Simiduia agarivorans]|uniref:Eight transmembrane protein EpsH n=1 Tax=Simiduia agarivorans (strain DSM 21679 / JCM 13881 / BCRC 17597 / SA1) TaxID=1117647 RepID=K4KLL1_SIMAS|nr:exosortase/archaeosortase family protein [Simiduia agarivorans]AFU98958.1 hypothetical protein M5M_08855 [Simiduia agarivorans SA1 = DSM 21679]
MSVVAGLSRNRNFTNVVLVLLLLVFFLPVIEAWRALAGYWGKFSETYAHGYMVLACTLYLLYERHQQDGAFAAAAAKYETFLAMMTCVAMGGLFVLADYVQVRIVMLLLMPALLFAWVYGVFGGAAARATIIPIGLLYTAIPFWEVLSVPLRVVAVAVTEFGLEILQIPAYIDGFKIELAYGVLEVAHGCSGLVYLLTSLALSIIMAALYFPLFTQRVMIVLAACVVGVVANWVRIYSLVLIAHYSKMESALVYDHEFYGWVVYLAFFGLFMFVLMRRAASGAETSEAAPEPDSQAIKTRVIAAVLLSASLAVSTLIISRVLNSPDVPAASGRFTMPGFRPLHAPEPSVRFLGYDEYSAWEGSLSGIPVRTDLLLYFKQEQGKELAYYLNDIALREEVAVRTTNIDGFNVKQLYGALRGRLVAWQYRVGGYATTHSLKLKLYEALNGLTGESVSALHTLSYLCKSRRCTDEEWNQFRQLDFSAVAASMDVVVSEASQ